MKFSVMVKGLVISVVGTLCLTLSLIFCMVIFADGFHWYDRLTAVVAYVLTGLCTTLMMYPAGIGAEVEEARLNAERKAKEAARAR